MRQHWLAVLIAAVTLVTVTSVTQGANWTIPQTRIQIKPILDSLAASGDTITVLEADDETELQEAFTVSYPVVIRNLTGQTITIEATTGYAVNNGVVVGSVLIEGFRIVGGTGPAAIYSASGEIRNCTIEDGGNDYTDGVVILDNASKLVSSTVTLTSTDSPRAIYLEGPSAELTNCTITTTYVSGSGALPVVNSFGSDNLIQGNSITISDSTSQAYAIDVSGGGAEVIGNSIVASLDGILTLAGVEGITDNFIRVRGIGTGISVSATGSAVIARNTIYSAPCDQAQGVWISNGSATLTIENNLFVNMDYGIFSNTGTSSATINHNIYWGSCASGSNLSLTSTQMANKEPVFCNSREGIVGQYSLKIDCEVARGNNGWYEQVGAYDAECAWGSLARSTTIAEFSTITVLEDVTVPSGKTLQVDSGSIVTFDEDDNGESGSSSTKNELILNGGFTVNGTSGDRVQFLSSKATPAEGDWYGIKANDIAVDMSYFDLKHAVYGLKIDGNDGYNREVNQGCFSKNQTYDLWITNSGTEESGDLDVTSNSFTIEGGTGIYVDSDYVKYLLISGNTLAGNASSIDGIRIDSSDTLEVIGNTVTDIENGEAFDFVEFRGVVRGNSLIDNKYGLRLAAGSPTIGPVSALQSGNTITGSSTTGLLVTGSGTDPFVRLNTIASNHNGVVTQSGADPDLGTSSDDGNNDLADNSNLCIWNRTAGDTIQAKGNFFDACPSLPGCTSGLVNVSNQLCTDPTSRVNLPVEPAPSVGPRLLGVSPNPFRSVAVFRVAPGSEAEVPVVVHLFDVSGRLVRTLEATGHGEENLQIAWDGRDSAGRPVASGLFLARAEVDRKTVGTTRIIVAR
jgi:uncharacterized protein (AIM24 family)